MRDGNVVTNGPYAQVVRGGELVGTNLTSHTYEMLEECGVKIDLDFKGPSEWERHVLAHEGEYSQHLPGRGPIHQRQAA